MHASDEANTRFDYTDHRTNAYGHGKQEEAVNESTEKARDSEDSLADSLEDKSARDARLGRTTTKKQEIY